MVKTKKKWETVYFTGHKKGIKPQEIELTINHEERSFTLMNEHEETVSFADKTIEEALLINRAIEKAIKYAKESLK